MKFIDQRFITADGIDFQLYSVTGIITITEVNPKKAKGAFEVQFANTFKGEGGKG